MSSLPSERKGPVVVIAGPPASGKGTQCKNISKELGLVHIGMGDIVREQAEEATALGIRVKDYMDRGEFVPDELVCDILKAQLETPEAKEKGCLIDGVPRTPAQAAWLADAMEIHKLVVLEVPEDVSVARALGRRMDTETGEIFHLEFLPPPADVVPRLVQRRNDKDEETVRKRLHVYYSQREAILNHFEGKVAFVNGAQQPADVFADILRQLPESMAAAVDGEDGWGDEAAPEEQGCDNFSLKIAPDRDVGSGGGICRVMVSVALHEIDPGLPELERTSSGQIQRAPVDICCVVDISGSMGTDASLESQSHSSGLSVLDVVKHAVKAVMHILKSSDRLALVVFDDKAETVFGLTAMTTEGRAQSVIALDTLRPRGQTNLWEGIRTGLEALQPGAERQKTLLVLTDGQPNISPPRGHLTELQEYKDSHPGFLFRLNTFGFGYDLDSKLLFDLAQEGHGTYAFVPDSAILGTVFVDSVANVLSTRLQNASLHLMPRGSATFAGPVLGSHLVAETSWGRVVNIGPVQFGQSREVVVPLSIPEGATPYLEAVLVYPGADGSERRTSALGEERSACAAALAAGLLGETIDTGYGAIQTADDGHCEEALQSVTDLGSRLEDVASRVDAQQLPFKADVQGRMVKALTGEDRFNRWGKHYLRALLRAHQLQTCTNFMDPGVQVYGGARFKAFRQEGDGVFVSIPAPRPAKDETGIPCERCGREIPFADYAEHIEICGTGRRPPAATAPATARPRTPSPDMNQYYAGSGGG